MKCPKDHADLTIDEFATLEVRKCSKCAGIFVPFTSLMTIKQTLNLPAKESFELDQLKWQEIDLSCPSCDKLMRVYFHYKLEIDVCRSCHGIWFDKYELEELIMKAGESKQDLIFDFFAGFFIKGFFQS